MRTCATVPGEVVFRLRMAQTKAHFSSRHSSVALNMASQEQENVSPARIKFSPRKTRVSNSKAKPGVDGGGKRVRLEYLPRTHTHTHRPSLLGEREREREGGSSVWEE